MAVNWSFVEDLYVAKALDDLREFATGRVPTDDWRKLNRPSPGEEFYGFFIDCNAFYSQIQGHLNSDVELQRKAEEYKRVHADLYSQSTIDELIEELRWSGGDWTSYWCVFDGGVAANTELDDFESEIEQDEHAACERFMEMACRVAIRLEDSRVFELLPRSNDFCVLCADHDETIADASRRLTRVRNSVRGA